MKTIHEQLDETRRRYSPPLRQLDNDPMRQVVMLLEASERGDWVRLQWLFRAVERRWALLGALVLRRRAAIGKCAWRVLPADESAEAAGQAARLTAFYSGLGNIEEVIAHLALSAFRGYSHIEIVPGADGLPAHLVPVPQWHFSRAGLDGPWSYLPDPDKRDQGIALEPGRWLWRETDRPINTVALVAFVRYQLGRKDWDSWTDTYGIPPLVVELPPDVPADLVAEYQAQAEAIIGNMRGTMANGAAVHNIGADVRQSQPFKEFLDGIEREVVLAATGGLLTVLNESTGLGSGQSDAHQDAFDDIAIDEARDISRILHRAIDRVILGENPLAHFTIEAQDEDDLTALADRVLKLSQAGFQADAEELSERFGITLEEKAESGNGKVESGNGEGTEGTEGAEGDEGAEEKMKASRVAGVPDLRAWRVRFQHTMEAEMRAALRPQ